VITHVVALTFTDESDKVEALARLEALLGQIDALRTLTVGLDVVGDAAAAHLALITTHDDVAGLAAYQSDPVHQEFLAWARPRLAARTVVDFAS
jgi:hypothetical protein